MTQIKTYVVFTLMALLSACAQPQASTGPLFPDLGPDDIVLSLGNSGGCDRGGRCLSFAITRSGMTKASALNRATGKPESVGTYQLPPDRIEAWLKQVERTDIPALLGTFEKGQSVAPTDGVDTFISVLPHQNGPSVSTIQYRLYGTQSLFSEALEFNRTLYTLHYKGP